MKSRCLKIRACSPRYVYVETLHHDSLTPLISEHKTKSFYIQHCHPSSLHHYHASKKAYLMTNHIFECNSASFISPIKTDWFNAAVLIQFVCSSTSRESNWWNANFGDGLRLKIEMLWTTCLYFLYMEFPDLVMVIDWDSNDFDNMCIYFCVSIFSVSIMHPNTRDIELLKEGERKRKCERMKLKQQELKDLNYCPILTPGEDQGERVEPRLSCQTCCASRPQLQLTRVGAWDWIEAKSEFQPSLGFIGLAIGFQKLVWFWGSRQRSLHGFHREHAVSLLLNQRGVVTGRSVVVDRGKLVPSRVTKLSRIQMGFGSSTTPLEPASSFSLVKVMRRVCVLG